MSSLRTIVYTLDDGQKITARELAKIIGVSESASRNRLNRSSDPKKVFKPYSVSNGGKARGSQKQKEQDAKDKEAEMMKFALKNI
jgi:transposase